MLRFYRPDLRPTAPPLKIPVYDTHGGGDIDAARTTIIVAGTDVFDANKPPRAAAVSVNLARRTVTHLFHLPGVLYMTAAAISPRGDMLVLGGGGMAAVYDLHSGALIGRPVRVAQLGTGALAWSADGSRFFGGGQDGVLTAWHVDANGVRSAGRVTLSTGAFISDIRRIGSVLAVAAEDGVLRLINPTTLQIQQPTYTAGGTQLQTAGIDPADDRVYATSRDGSLRIWDRKSGRAIGPALAGNLFFSSALIATGRRTLYSAGGGSLVKWDLSPRSWLVKSCALAGRNLTRTEWDTYLPGHTYRKTCGQYPAGN